MPLAPSPPPATLRCRSARTFETWLRKNHSASEGVWLEIAKPDAPEASVGYVEAKAEAFFSTLNAANRYAVLWRVQTAKKRETRVKRIETLVAMLARGEKIHP